VPQAEWHGLGSWTPQRFPRGIPTAAHLIAHHLHAAVIDPPLESTHRIVREKSLPDSMRRAVQQLPVWPEHPPRGSVNPWANMNSPVISFGMKWRFCSSVPAAMIAGAPLPPSEIVMFAR